MHRKLFEMFGEPWHQWLSSAEHWYNTNYHITIKLTLFQALYGYEPSQLSIGPYLLNNHPEVEQIIEARNRVTQLLRENLVEAQNRMKIYADSHISEREFNVGDQVYLKFQDNLLLLLENVQGYLLNILVHLLSLTKLGRLHTNWSCHRRVQSTWCSMSCC